MPSLPTQSSSTPHFDSCCSPSHSQHSSTSKLKTKSDSCPFHCTFLMFVVAWPWEIRFSGPDSLLYPCLKKMSFSRAVVAQAFNPSTREAEASGSL